MAGLMDVLFRSAFGDGASISERPLGNPDRNMLVDMLNFATADYHPLRAAWGGSVKPLPGGPVNLAEMPDKRMPPELAEALLNMVANVSGGPEWSKSLMDMLTRRLAPGPGVTGGPGRGRDVLGSSSERAADLLDFTQDVERFRR